MFTKHPIDLLYTTSASHLFVNKEYLCLPNFVVIGSEVIEEPNSTLFVVDKIYGWSNRDRCYSTCLFEAKDVPAVGIWQHDCLSVYLDISSRYLRMTYFAKRGTLEKNAEYNGIYYQLLADTSTDGIKWQRVANSKYGR